MTENMGGWSAHAVIADFGRQIKIAAVKQEGYDRQTYVEWDKIGKDGWAAYHTMTESEAREASINTDSAAWLTVDMFAAMAIYNALGKYFEGVSSVKAARQDYEAERARVDKMIDALIKRQP